MPPAAANSRAPYLAFASSRLLLVVTAHFVLTQFPVHTIEPWMAQIFPQNAWIDGWVRWDSFWYESIVDSTARFLPPDHSNANFFPAYASASWVAGLPFRLLVDNSKAFFLGGIMLSHAAFLLGLVGVFRITETMAGRGVAERTVWLMAFFPFSFFFAAVYADGLYFCLSVWTFRYAQRERWRPASILSVVATLTRITGFMLMAGIVAELIRRKRGDANAIRKEVWAAAILIVAPVLLFTYYYVRYGDPIAFVHARQAGWQRAAGVGSLLTDLDYYTQGSLFSCGGVRDCLRGWDFTRQLMGIWYLALVPIGIGLAIAARRTIGAGQLVWVVGTYWMALVNGLDGMGRFTSVLFPVFIALALLVVRSRTAVVAVCLAWIPFLLLFLGGFVRWRAVL